MNQNQGPLSGLRVMDMTQVLAGPYCTMILGDLGAEVIKIENPAGELSRTLPPYFLDEDSVYYYSVNRNKKSLALDLKNPESIKIMESLAQHCDVLVENYRPGVMEKLGVSYSRLSAINPRFIWCSISGYGQNGPHRDLPAYDLIIQALSGGMSMTGEVGGSPVRAAIPLADLAGGMFASIGILSAVEERHRTGKGKMVDISLLDNQISMLCFMAAYYLFSGNVPGPLGNESEYNPTYRTFTARDGRDVVVCALTDDMWVSMCRAIEAPELLKDPRFFTKQDRSEHMDVLIPILKGIFKTRDADEWIAVLQKAQVPVGEVKTIDRALNDPQVLYRNMVLKLDSQDGRSFQAVGNPVRFDRGNLTKHRFPPSLGQDSVEILTTLLEKSEDEIGRLIESGVVFVRKKPG